MVTPVFYNSDFFYLDGFQRQVQSGAEQWLLHRYWAFGFILAMASWEPFCVARLGGADMKTWSEIWWKWRRKGAPCEEAAFRAQEYEDRQKRREKKSAKREPIYTYEMIDAEMQRRGWLDTPTTQQTEGKP